MAALISFTFGAILFFGGIATFSPAAAVVVGGFLLMVIAVQIPGRPETEEIR